MPGAQITRNGNVLTVSSPQIELHPGEAVEWNFPELALDELAFIHFDHLDHPETEPYGPFQCLEPSRTNVRGLGNTGQPGEYRYTAFVLNHQGVVAASDGHAKILNLSAEVDTSPEATIRCDATGLHVDPPRLRVDDGQTALWYITGLPAGHFVTFRFDVSTGEDPLTGPFDSFQMSRGISAGQVATGSKFNGSSAITYRVRLHRPDGSIRHEHDPVIEPPPGWPPDDGGVAEP